MNPEPKKKGRGKSDTMNLGPKESKLKVKPIVPTINELTADQVVELATKRNLIWTSARSILERRYSEYLKTGPGNLVLAEGMAQSEEMFVGVESFDKRLQLAIRFLESKDKIVTWKPDYERVTVNDLLSIEEVINEEEDETQSGNS